MKNQKLPLPNEIMHTIQDYLTHVEDAYQFHLFLTKSKDTANARAIFLQHIRREHYHKASTRERLSLCAPLLMYELRGGPDFEFLVNRHQERVFDFTTITSEQTLLSTYAQFQLYRERITQYLQDVEFSIELSLEDLHRRQQKVTDPLDVSLTWHGQVDIKRRCERSLKYLSYIDYILHADSRETTLTYNTFSPRFNPFE